MARSAISAAAEGDYDVILMDMMMPEVDGLTATRMIRAGEPPRCDTVIIGLTANALPSDRAACRGGGHERFRDQAGHAGAVARGAGANGVRCRPGSGPIRRSRITVMLDAAFLRPARARISVRMASPK